MSGLSPELNAKLLDLPTPAAGTANKSEEPPLLEVKQELIAEAFPLADTTWQSPCQGKRKYTIVTPQELGTTVVAGETIPVIGSYGGTCDSYKIINYVPDKYTLHWIVLHEDGHSAQYTSSDPNGTDTLHDRVGRGTVMEPRIRHDIQAIITITGPSLERQRQIAWEAAATAAEAAHQEAAAAEAERQRLVTMEARREADQEAVRIRIMDKKRRKPENLAMMVAEGIPAIAEAQDIKNDSMECRLYGQSKKDWYCFTFPESKNGKLTINVAPVARNGYRFKLLNITNTEGGKAVHTTPIRMKIIPLRRKLAKEHKNQLKKTRGYSTMM